MPTATQRPIKFKSGFSIIEVLVAIFVFIIIATALIYLLVDTSSANIQEKLRFQATALAEEGLEAARNIRDSSWSNLSPGTYGLAKVNNQWQLSGQSDVDASGQFTRQIIISAISADQFLLTSNVSYNSAGLRPLSVSVSTYLTNWRQVTQPPPPTWEAPVIKAIVGTGYTGNNKNPRCIFVNGNYAYLGTEETNANDPEFFVFNISDPTNPTLAGTFKVGGRVNSIDVIGNYAYLATDRDNAELVVLKIGDPTNITQVATADTARNYDGTSVFVAGGYVYLGTQTSLLGNELSIFDATNPEAISNTPVGQLTLGATPYSINVSGDFAYIGTDKDNSELMVVNIADKSHPLSVGSYDLPGSADAHALKVAGNTLYVGTSVNTTQNPEFYILQTDTSNPNNVKISLVGSLKIGASVNDLDIDLAANRVFLATDSSSAEFYVVDISNPAAPAKASSLDLPGIAVGLKYNGNYAFVADVYNSEELIVVGP